MSSKYLLHAFKDISLANEPALEAVLHEALVESL